MEASVAKSANVVIDYPGVVVSVPKMLQTLGGESNISKVYNDPIMRLDMKMRPDDVFCKPACADRHQTRTLILKVKQKPLKTSDKVDTAQKTNDTDDACKTSHSELEAEVVGIAETEYRFECLADFQYLAMKKKEDGSGFESFYDRIVPPRNERVSESFITDKNAPLFLPSPVYARMDRPSDYSYKDRPESKREKPDQPEGVITLDRAKRPHFSKFHSFKSGDVPMEPYPQALERYNSKPHPTELDYLIILGDLFKKRPLWTKIAISSVTKYGREILKQTLPLVAYYWDTGPWRTMWCAYGFDPRKEPSAKIYQLIDFRLKGRIFSDINIKRSSTKPYNLPPQITRSGTGSTPATIRHSDLQEPGAEVTEDIDDSDKLVKFNPNVLPPQRQFFYQLLDIEMDEVQELIHANDGEETQCTEKDGWCLENTIEKIRKTMTAAVARFLEKERLKDPSGVKSALPVSSWEKKKPYHSVMPSKKGKSGPKHQPKRLSVGSKERKQNESETSLENRLSALDVGSDSEETSSESYSDYSDEVDASQRELRTQKVVQELTGNLSEESDEHMFTDSDNDPDYNPKME